MTYAGQQDLKCSSPNLKNPTFKLRENLTMSYCSPFTQIPQLSTLGPCVFSVSLSLSLSPS